MKWSVAERLGDAIRRRRIASGRTQVQFADAIGMTPAYYSAIERGEKNLTLITLYRVAQGLGAPMAELLDGVEG